MKEMSREHQEEIERQGPVRLSGYVSALGSAFFAPNPSL